MACRLRYTAFNEKGYVTGSGDVSLPESLDWKSIEEKGLFMEYRGGLPDGSRHVLLDSQGQKMLLLGLSESATEKLDADILERKLQNVESHLKIRCAELGIDRTAKPRNQ